MKLCAKGAARQYFRNSKGSNVFYAVESTDLELEGGSLTAVLGRSGSGKSTLLNMMAGLLKPTLGTVELDGTDIYALSDAERSRLRNERFGIIPQGQTALLSLTVMENVLLPVEMYGGDVLGRKNKALELLTKLGIERLSGVYPADLSGGEMRRLAIARALINDPSVILADEPTGDLDDENTAEVLGILRSLADKGAAVLLVTHENDAVSYADRVFRMAEGRLSEFTE